MTDELRIDARPELERPVMIAAFRGWNDGGQGASLAGAYLARAWAATRVRVDRSRELLRLPGDAADGLARRRRDAPDRLARERLPARADAGQPAATRSSCSASSRTFAGARSREQVTGSRRDFGAELVLTLGSLLADVPHTRPAPVTGSATDPELIEPARAAGVALRGADGHRRRPPRRVQPGRPQVGEPLGSGTALRVADAVPACREGTRRPPGGAARRRHRHRRARRGSRVVRAAGERSRRRRRRDAVVRRGARAAGRRARRRGRTSPRATRSPPS